MSAPRYHEAAPRAELAHLVHCAWSFIGPADDTPQRIAPDGRPELIVHVGAPYLEAGTPQPAVLFAGQLTAPLTLVAQADVAVVGVRLHAYAARAFLGASADAATDRRLDLAAAHGPVATALRMTMQAAAPERWAALAQDYVAARCASARIDADVRAAVEAMFAGGAVEPPQHGSERQWQRRFKAEVGISPRMLMSVLRFRRVFDAIEQPETEGWVGAALAAGYFDQPQMARDFRRFLGCTAREWAARADGLAKALASQTYKTA